MKKIIISLVLLICIKINGSFWDSITDVVHKVTDGVKSAGETAVGGLKTAGEATGGGLKTAGEAVGGFFQHQVSSCVELTGLEIAYAVANQALDTAKLAVNSAEIVGKKTALDNAQAALTDIEKTSEGILTLSNAIAKGLGEGLNITCIRFFGSIEELEFELNATILGKSVTVREKVDFSDGKSFVQKIFEALQDEIKKTF